MSAPVDAYPLAWPVGWERTASWQRKGAPYQVSFARARDELMRSIRLLGGTDVVISSNVPLRRDGLPYANVAEPRDAGVAVYWTQKRKPRVMACDCWSKVRDNLRAIGLAIDGLRAVERSGASQILERAFTGFAALPADAGAVGVPHWRDVLEYGNSPPTREAIDRHYRILAQDAHPDKGGSNERMVELNRAREQALREVPR